MFSHIGMQGEDIIEHTIAKCHLCTLWLTDTPLCNISIAPHNVIEHTHAKILVNGT